MESNGADKKSDTDGNYVQGKWTLRAHGSPPAHTHQLAFDATRRVFLLIAAGAVNLLLAWYERLGADRGLADAAREAFLMPLASLVLHLLRTCERNAYVWNSVIREITRRAISQTCSTMRTI